MKSPEAKSLINGWTISLLIVTSGVVIILAGIFYYNSEEKSIRQEKYNELKAIAGLKSEQLQQWRSDRLMDANVTQSVFFGKAIADFAGGDSTPLLKQNLTHRLNQYHDLYKYEQAVIATPEGKPILFMNNKVAQLDPVTIAELKMKANSPVCSYSDIYFSENNKRFQMDIFAPVILERSVKAWLILQIDPQIFLFPLIQSWPTPSKSAETVLVKKDGNKVLFINELRHRKNTALNLRLPLTDTAYVAVKAMMGRTGIYDGKDYRGVQVIADLRKIEGTNWFMITKIDKSELFDELYYRAKLVSGLFLLIILLLVTGLVLIYNYRQRKIYADLYRAEKILADTEDEFRTTLSSINDAVVICNKDGLIQSMNNNAEMITGWQESEVLGKDVSELLLIMDAESRERIENPLHHLLFKPETKLISKYNLVSRNNEEIPITISAAKISSSSRKISGIILSFKDQTTAREAELKLRYSEEVFSKLFHLGTFPTALIRLSDLKIMDVNQSLTDTLGYSKEAIVGKKLDELKIWKTLDRLDSFLESLKENGTINKYEFKFITEDGNERIGLIFARIIDLHKDKFMMTRIMDITEQKLSEQALKESEQLYRNLFEGMTNGYAYCKLIFVNNKPVDFTVIKVNGVFYSLTGFPPVEGKKISEILPGIQEQDPGVFELLARFVSEGTPVQFEYYLAQIDQWFRVNAYLPNEGNMVVLFDVITEKKKSELALVESEKRYRSVLENMMESCQILSPDWRYLYLNDTACKIARYPREEMLGKKVTDFFYDFESTEMFTVLNKCMTERISMRREFEFDFHDGRIGWFEFSIQPVQEGIFILGLDITERKQALEKIEAQYSLLTSLINSPSNMNIFTLDRDYCYTSFNRNHADQFKQFLKIDISIGMNLLDSLPAKFAMVAKERVDQALNGESFNEIFALPDSGYTYEVSWNPINNGGQITGITVFTTDITERIKAQEEVLAAKKKIETSEIQYRLLAERMVDVVGVINLNTMKFQYISPSIEQLLGYTVDEVMNGPMKTILSPANRDKINTRLQESLDLMKKGVVNSVNFLEEIEQIKKDGSYIWTDVATSLAFNEKGEIELTGIIRDISERKKNEEQLKASEERFRQLLELVPYPLGYVDKFGTIVFRNEKFSHTLGYTFEDIPTMKEWWTTAFPDPVYRSEAMALWNSLAVEAVSTGSSIPAKEYRLLCKNGEFRHFEISGIEYAEGLLATFIDVTERRRNENFERLGHVILKELNENKNTELMLTNIARQIKKHTGVDAVGIRLKDGQDYPYISAFGFNDKFIRNEKHLCTYDENGVIETDAEGKPMLDCICGCIIKKSYNQKNPSFTEGGSFYSNSIQEWLNAENEIPKNSTRIKSRCKSSGFESIALIPIHSGSETLGLIQLNDKKSNAFKEGTIPYFESIGASIGLAIVRNQAQGELLRINQELDQRVKERTAQLQAANTELESFSYSVSHDLRAPLRHIGGFAQILNTEYKPELPEKAQHYLNTIDHSVKIMGTLIDDLLQFSRTGRADVKKKEIKMDAVVDDALGQVLSQAVSRDIKWDIKPLPKVMADESLIKQVWMNLLSNAIKYSRTKDITEISIGYTELEMEYHFYVKDNGIGFDMKYVHKLFGVFQRLHSADIFEGTGIGLANVRRIISRHGGSTWAEGVVDQGATFYFSLPKS